MPRRSIPPKISAQIRRVHRSGNSNVITLPAKFLKYLIQIYGEFEQVEVILIRDGPDLKPFILIRPYIPTLPEINMEGIQI